MEDDEFAAWSAQIDLITDEEELERLREKLEQQKPQEQRLLSKLYKKRLALGGWKAWPAL